MKKILFINRKAKNCGVHDYGVRFYDIVKNSNNFDIFFADIDSINDFSGFLNSYRPDIILYNYISHIFPFMSDSLIRPISHIPQIILFHEGIITFTPSGILAVDSTAEENPSNNFYNLPRPIFENKISSASETNLIPTIGSFGFGFTDKNFPKIAELVCKQFETAKIRLNIPFAQFGDEQGHIAKNEIEKIKNIIKNSNKNIELEYSHEFLEHDEILKFLAQNDINVFLYDKHTTRGLSSAIDYSLSAKKPIAINDSNMFRHINKSEPSIIVSETNTLVDIMKNGTKPLEPFYEKYSNNNLIIKFEDSINKIINK